MKDFFFRLQTGMSVKSMSNDFMSQTYSEELYSAMHVHIRIHNCDLRPNETSHQGQIAWSSVRHCTDEAGELGTKKKAKAKGSSSVPEESSQVH